MKKMQKMAARPRAHTDEVPNAAMQLLVGWFGHSMDVFLGFVQGRQAIQYRGSTPSRKQRADEKAAFGWQVRDLPNGESINVKAPRPEGFIQRVNNGSKQPSRRDRHRANVKARPQAVALARTLCYDRFPTLIT